MNSDALAVLAEDPVGNVVERAAPHAARILADQQLDAMVTETEVLEFAR